MKDFIPPFRASETKLYAWEFQPDYISACRDHWPGGPTSYDPPRQVGMNPQDVTAFKAGQAHWSLKNLPDILYRVRAEPRNDWETFRDRAVPVMLDGEGKPLLEKWPIQSRVTPRTMRHFPILEGIDVIGSLEHPLFLLALRRLDPAIQWPDIHMRMHPDGRPAHADRLNERLLNNFRLPFFLIDWHSPDQHNIHLPAIRATLKATGSWERNSSRGLAPGLRNPEVGETGGRVPWPDMGDGASLGKKWCHRYTESEEERRQREGRAAAEAAYDQKQLREAAEKAGYWLSQAPDQHELKRWHGFMNVDGFTDEERAVLDGRSAEYPFPDLRLSDQQIIRIHQAASAASQEWEAWAWSTGP